MIYVFGALLLFTAVRILVSGTGKIEPGRNLFVLATKRIFPVEERLHGERFWIRREGGVAITPLFLTLVVVETSDILFAVDSIPAIFAITRDPFLVFTSNIFAILGLRSLYFVLAGMMEKFGNLKYSLSVLLAFVGIKMVTSHYIVIPTTVSLLSILFIIGSGVVTSLFHRESNKPEK